jgi:GNAT superfamily N-acetyltransferase
MPKEDLTIRQMNREDVEVAVEWAAREGWNPGLHDADCFYAADPNGFFMAEINGEPAGCISAVAYDENFGFMGFYIVRKDLRHRGIGMKLWNAAIDYMRDRTIGGDGVVGMLPKYEQWGFRIAHHNARYEGVGKYSPLRLPDLGNLAYGELEGFDRRFFPAARSAFLKCWTSRPGSHARAVIFKGHLAGYGVIRPCRTGFKIGPLFADALDIADELFACLSSFAEGKPVFLDIPVCNRAARELADRHAMRAVFETARIYKGSALQLPLEDIYGITSFELG